MLAPVLLFLLGLVVAAGRTSIAQGSVDAAARDAARQASISLTPGAAQAAALSSAKSALSQDGRDLLERDPLMDLAAALEMALAPGELVVLRDLLEKTVFEMFPKPFTADEPQAPQPEKADLRPRTV